MDDDIEALIAQTGTHAPESGLIRPHGGGLVQRFVAADSRHEAIERLAGLPRVLLNDTEMHDLEMLACGGYSPLNGFMDRETCQSVIDAMVLPDGLAWGLPITVTVARESARALSPGRWIALEHSEQLVGALFITDIFPEPRLGAREQPAGMDPQFCLGGPIMLLANRLAPFLMPGHRWPREVRGSCDANGWRRLAAVHVWNPWQRVQEYHLRCVLESSDALLLQLATVDGPIADGLPAAMVAEACRTLMNNYFPSQRIILNPMPRRLLGGGARAALQHAILSQNYGCGRIFFVRTPDVRKRQTAERDEALARAHTRGLLIETRDLDPAFHCEVCGGVATERSCPHDGRNRIVLDESAILNRLLAGEHLPPMVTRPEIARALSRAMPAVATSAAAAGGGQHLFPHAAEVTQEFRQMLTGHGIGVLWMTGLSGAGKSTIASRVERELLLRDHRVTVLDGDSLRHGLNRDLDFSPASRRENLRRAAEVARVMADAGMIVIASFISPLRADRELARDIIGKHLYEIHVHAPLADCEARDPKGLYRRARQGLISEFTGVSAPYEAPERPDLSLDTSCLSVEQCVTRLLEFMGQAGLARGRWSPTVSLSTTSSIHNVKLH